MRRISLVLALTLAACGPGASGDDAPGVDAHVRPDADTSPDGTPVEQSRVYGHSPSELYRIDTNNLNPIDIGPFGLASGSITDIAVDKNGVMFGVSLSHIYSINPDTGAAAQIATFNGTGNLTGLSFVPVDPSDPQSDEILVTAGSTGDVYEVSQTDGTTSPLGNFGMYMGHQITLSGDIVSVRDYGTLATVDVTGNFTDHDWLATIDPTNNWVATPVGTVGTTHDKIFGLAFWGGTIFGFVDETPAGHLVTIDPVAGTSTDATNQTFPWYGAGVTTVAPIVN